MPRVAGKIATTSPATKAHAYTPAWRLAAAGLVAVSRGSLLGIFLWLVFAPDTVPLFPLLRPVILFWALPGAAAALVRWACVAQVSGREDTLLLCARDRTIEVPYASIARVVPWRVPLPGPGLSLRLRSGRRVTHGIEVADPAAVLAAPAAAGAPWARDALAHPAIAWARARAAARRERWYHRVGKFAGFALLPAAVVFNAHQHIAFGGTFGQYYLEGPSAYARTFAIYWAYAATYLLLWAAVWRAAAEGIAGLAAAVAPSHTARVRRAVEIGCRLAYYVGVPVIVAVPFLR
jgi:hypothetical protein